MPINAFVLKMVKIMLDACSIYLNGKKSWAFNKIGIKNVSVQWILYSTLNNGGYREIVIDSELDILSKPNQC